jgi:hypothetical protein
LYETHNLSLAILPSPFQVDPSAAGQKAEAPRQTWRGASGNSSGLFSSFLRGASHLLNRHVWILKRTGKRKSPVLNLHKAEKLFLAV